MRPGIRELTVRSAGGRLCHRETVRVSPPTTAHDVSYQAITASVAICACDGNFQPSSLSFVNECF